MTPDALLRNRLASVTEVTQLVPPGSITCGGELPQGATYPAITCILEDDPEETVLDGPAGLSAAVVAVECYARENLSAGETGLALAKRIASAVTSAANYYSGPIGADEVELIVRRSIADIEKDTESEIYGVSLQFVVWHR